MQWEHNSPGAEESKRKWTRNNTPAEDCYKDKFHKRGTDTWTHSTHEKHSFCNFGQMMNKLWKCYHCKTAGGTARNRDTWYWKKRKKKRSNFMCKQHIFIINNIMRIGRTGGAYFSRPKRNALNLYLLCRSCGSSATRTWRLKRTCVFGPWRNRRRKTLQKRGCQGGAESEKF